MPIRLPAQVRSRMRYPSGNAARYGGRTMAKTPGTDRCPAACAVPLSLRERLPPPRDATQATRDAGLTSTNDDALGALARKILGKVSVGEYLREVRDEFLDAEKATVWRIAKGLSRAAFVDRTGIFDDHGDVRNPAEWPEELRSILVGFDLKVTTDRDTGTTIRSWKIRFADPMDALGTLAAWRCMIGPQAHAEKDAAEGGAA